MSCSMNEEAGCASKTEENCREMEDVVCTNASILTTTGNMMCSSEETQLLSKPSPTYIALIAKVILSSPSKKLNLAAIYRAMEDQFPYLRNRGPGWRNSVRHNLSVHDCFVKVNRCEDGRGHYWGIHQAHLRDFQQDNFRRYRTVRGRRERERYNDITGHLAWMKTSCLCLKRFSESRSLACLESHCPLLEPRGYQLNQPHYQPWFVNVCWLQSPSWRNQSERLSDFTATSGHMSQPMTSRLHCFEMNDLVLTGARESHDNRLLIPQIQPVRFPVCWCVPKN